MPRQGSASSPASAPAPSVDPLGRLEPDRRRERREVAAEHQRRRGHHGRLVGEQLVAHLAPDLERRDVQPGGDALARLAEPEDVGLVGRGHPLGGDEHLLGQALGLGEARVGLAGVGLLRVRRHAGARGIAHQGEGLGQLLGQRVEATRRRGGDGVLQRIGGLGQPVGLLVDVPLRAAGRPLDVGDRQLVGRRLGHPRHDLVRLVDHDRVVVGDHRDALDRVDGEQRVVGDDQVGPERLLLGPLGEALLRERALRRAQALAMVDADLPPRAVVVPRGVVALAAAPGLGLLLGPGAELEHLGALRTGGHLDQHALVVGHALADAVQAGVVGAALQDGVRRVDAGHRADRLHQARDVALDELVLERQRRGRDDHAGVVQERGDEVGQGLAGAGAGLDEQVLSTRERRADRLGHGHLAGALLAAEGRDRGRQDVAERRRGGAPSGSAAGSVSGTRGSLATGADCSPRSNRRPSAVRSADMGFGSRTSGGVSPSGLC